ncbi:hypothetical protein M5D96_012014, partial [Drosophila gunungcola]
TGQSLGGREGHSAQEDAQQPALLVDPAEQGSAQDDGDGGQTEGDAEAHGDASQVLGGKGIAQLLAIQAVLLLLQLIEGSTGQRLTRRVQLLGGNSLAVLTTTTQPADEGVIPADHATQEQDSWHRGQQDHQQCGILLEQPHPILVAGHLEQSDCSTVAASMPIRMLGHRRSYPLSRSSSRASKRHSGGITMMYSVRHWVQVTGPSGARICFSSIQRLRQDSCTHLLVPRQRHGECGTCQKENLLAH